MRVIFTGYDRANTHGMFKTIYTSPYNKVHLEINKLKKKINPNPRTPEEALENQKINQNLQELYNSL